MNINLEVIRAVLTRDSLKFRQLMLRLAKGVDQGSESADGAPFRRAEQALQHAAQHQDHQQDHGQDARKRPQFFPPGGFSGARRQRGVADGQEHDHADEDAGQHNAGENAGQEQLAHGFLGDDGIENETHGGRDKNAQSAPGRQTGAG
jgi:hypothetical protein